MRNHINGNNACEEIFVSNFPQEAINLNNDRNILKNYCISFYNDICFNVWNLKLISSIKTLVCYKRLFNVFCFIYFLIVFFQVYNYHFNSTKAEILFNKSNISLHYIKVDQNSSYIDYISFIFLLPIYYIGIYILKGIHHSK